VHAEGRGIAAGPTPRERWFGLGVVLVGTMMTALDSTIVNIALPQIGRALDAGQNIQWVVTANLLAVAVSLPAAGWLASRTSAKDLFLVTLAVFSLASFAAALAPNLWLLVAARVVQGMCAGVINPISMTIVLDLFPAEERGRAMGVWGLVAMSAPAVGPTLGGYLVTAVSWHWLFFPNVPLGLLGAFVGRRLLVDSPPRPRTPLDVRGLLLGASGLALFLFVLAESRRWGWLQTSTLSLFALSAVLLAAFVRHALRTTHPLLELRLVRTPTFRVALYLIALVTVAQYARSVFVPQQFQVLRGYSALKVGLMLTPSAAATAVSMALGGRLVDRLGARPPIRIGLVCLLLGSLGNAFLATTTPAWWIALALTVQCAGVGLVMIPATVAGLNALDDVVLPQASTVRSLVNQVAAAVGVAVMFAVVNALLAGATDPAGRQRAYNTSFQMAAVAVLVALAVTTRLREPRPTV
jgi:EmrB/QacA subfamily drug resistance transporter